MGLEPAIHPLALWPGDRRTGLRVDRRSSPRHSVPCSAGGLQADLSDHLGPAQKLLRVLTASGRAWRHRLAVKYARYYRGEPVAPDTPSHSSNSLSNSCARPEWESRAPGRPSAASIWIRARYSWAGACAAHAAYAAERRASDRSAVGTPHT